MHEKDCAQSGRYVVENFRRMQGDKDPVWIGDEDIADVIANLLHLARELEFDPEETLNKGWSYFDGDAEEKETAVPRPDAIGFHGSPAALFPGEVLKPAGHLVHVFAEEDPDMARMWGRKKSETGGSFVYKVQLSEDAEHGSAGLYATTATVLECIDIKEQSA